MQHDFSFAGRTFPGYAEFHSHGEQYVLVKRAKLWEVDVHEHLFFECVDHLDEALLADLVSFMKTEAVKKVEPKANHMTTYLSLVVVADEVDDKAAKAVRAVRFRKDFRLGLWGWADLRLAVVDLARAAVMTNAAGKSLRATLEANAFDRRHR